jgi:hypothetical protein
MRKSRGFSVAKAPKADSFCSLRVFRGLTLSRLQGRWLLFTGRTSQIRDDVTLSPSVL